MSLVTSYALKNNPDGFAFAQVQFVALTVRYTTVKFRSSCPRYFENLWQPLEIVTFERGGGGGAGGVIFGDQNHKSKLARSLEMKNKHNIF